MPTPFEDPKMNGNPLLNRGCRSYLRGWDEMGGTFGGHGGFDESKALLSQKGLDLGHHGDPKSMD